MAERNNENTVKVVKEHPGQAVFFLISNEMSNLSNQDSKRIDIAGSKSAADMPASTPKVAPSLWIAAARGRTAEVKKLLADGADIEERGGPWKSSALQEAAVGSHEQVVSILLENGASVSAQDTNGTTPIHFATSEEVVQLLCDALLAA